MRPVRYALGRTWAPVADDWEGQGATLNIVMLNPSTGDHTVDDPTVRKVMHFARQEGCGGVLVPNLDAFRATDPREVRAAPRSALNLAVLEMPRFFSLRGAAWGSLGPKWLRLRLSAPATIAKQYQHALSVFGLTKDGDPRHPLYVANSARAVSWAVAAAEQP